MRPVSEISSKLALAGLACLLLGLSTPTVPTAAGAAVVDPERNLYQPTGWQWWTNRSEEQINALRAEGWRLVDIEVESRGPYRFAAAFVHNSGSYARAGGWWYGMSPAQVSALTRDGGRRPIDVEPYTVNGKRRFAIVAVRNKGVAKKGWRRDSGLTPAQLNADVAKHKIRPIDLDTYTVNGRRLYSYVGIKNSGVDASAWWWYYGVTPEFVQRKAELHGARLIDVEPSGGGRMTVLMVRNTGGVFTLSTPGLTEVQLARFVASNGVRIVDLNREGDKWSAVTIDNVDAETGRLRAILRESPYRSGYFGVFAKRVGGPTYVGLAHDSDYQPMSVMKLLPHLYAMDQVNRGTTDLDTETVTWTTPADKPKNVWCPGMPGPTQTRQATLREALQLSLGQSLNPVHQALVDKFGVESIDYRVHALGLERTHLHSGCDSPQLSDWRSNTSTLTDMGELFEGVDTRRFFPLRWQQARDEFYGLMANWPTDWFLPVVTDEAEKLHKDALVHDFITRIEFDGKGGSYDLRKSDREPFTTWRAFSYRVAFPIKEAAPVRGGFVLGLQPYVGGFFVNEMTAPCNQEEAQPMLDNVGKECRDYVIEMNETWVRLIIESQRTAIREALATW